MDMQYFDQIRCEIGEILPDSFGVVMEIGCGVGSTLQWLKGERESIKTIGVEISEEAAELAKKNCDKVYQIDVVSEFNVLADYEKMVDVILLLDILEHLEDPWDFLHKLRGLLSDGGVIIASIPNIRNIKALGPLIFKDEWTYVKSGILDRTHLRFFTKKSIVELFEKSGYSINSVIPNGPVSIAKAKTKAGKVVAFLNMLILRKGDGFIANQYLVSARRS